MPFAIGTILGFLGLVLLLRLTFRGALRHALHRSRTRNGAFGHFVSASDRRPVEIGMLIGAGLASLLALLVRHCWPVFFAAVALPIVAAVSLAFLSAQRRRALEQSAATLLRSLRGLIAAGFALPTAMALAADHVPGTASRRLAQRLSALEEGRSFLRCLERFRRKLRPRTLRAAFEGMGIAYADGLPLLPLLDRLLPTLERELDAEALVRELRARAFAQAAFAALLPWLVCFALQAMQPEMSLRESAPFWGFAVLWECVGGAVVWRACRYR